MSDPDTPVPTPATRRMVRGLAFTSCLLGLLALLGGLALDLPWMPLVGLLLALAGAVAYLAVHRALRRGSPRPAGRRPPWWIPGFLLLAGTAFLLAVFAVDPVLTARGTPDLVDDWVSVLVVSGMTLVVAAGLGFGLCALSLLSAPDEDDSPLRPTGFARRSDGPDHFYDSRWIRGHRPR